DGQPRPVTRDYTPRRFDAKSRMLVIDFVVHGAGVASDWAERAEPGMQLGIAGPRGSIIVDDDFDWYLAVGDETALPSIARRLEEAPASQRIVAVIEVENVTEEQEIETAADSSVYWVHRNGAPAGSTSLLFEALRELPLPEGEGFTWVEGEATTVRDIRRYLLNERGFDREHCRFSGHWKLGVVNHDHHAPIDEDDTRS
ncbi:MAG TPA: siderophore-interacting protein, partial [Thermomicrobiales bacterium]|nr:siderophore-interacting protein [Thermomicrobiales bacterium]